MQHEVAQSSNVMFFSVGSCVFNHSLPSSCLLPFFSPPASMSSWRAARTIQYPDCHTSVPPPHQHINAIHFLFSHTLLVMVQRGNWFPLPAGLDGHACICITRRGMKMICANLSGSGVRSKRGRVEGWQSSGVSISK